MKKVVFPFLSILMLGLSGCLDKGGDNYSSYSSVPAIVQIDYTTLQPVLITSLGKFIAPELQSALYTDLNEGDAILTNFSIYDNLQTSDENIIVSNVLWVKIGQTSPRSTSGGGSSSDNFDLQNGGMKIEGMDIYDIIQYDYNKTVMFLVFTHTTFSDQKFDYEMTYDYNENTDIYIRAKKNGTASQVTATFSYLYAFDMSSYLMTLSQGGKKVSFNLKYKTGEEDGKDVYGEYEKAVEIELE